MANCEYKTNNVVKKTCDSYAGAGLCGIPEMFRCVEYIERFEPRLSHSGITNFIRCPQMYYYSNIMGLQTRPENQSDPLKIGSAVDDYITNIMFGGEPTDDTVYPDGEIKTMWQAKSIGIIKAFNKMINIDAVKRLYTGQAEFLLEEDGQPTIKGYIDLEAKSKKRFIELKCGKSPSYYTQLFYIRSKLAAYFMSRESYESGVIWAIRVPQIRLDKKKSEGLADYSARCTRVMVAEPSHYFPGYSHKSRNFGIKFGRSEIDLVLSRKYYRMVADWIKQSTTKDVWLKNGTGCLHPFECDYLHICENNGAISEDVYTRRTKETRGLKIQS